ncbi:hypothetical protein BFC18_10765 [Alteromonas confluentis]|uniref:Uncharacterized protein n=2 Tax=Alteromonas confluentis TaxID=1656094 RepID=A0A1E7ZBN2_9ALTE|nr:hypothetical protein BFC18_10765 [Alteromonas confluentis]
MEFFADMKALAVYLLIGVIAVLVQSTVYAMPMQANMMNHSHSSASANMSASAHMSVSANSDAGVTAMTMSAHGMSEECCQQDCHCDMSLCHAGLVLPARLAITFSVGFTGQTIASTSPALAAFSSPPYRPPIHI